MRKIIIWAVVGLWVVMGLFSCGGGGGGGTTTSTTTPIGTTVNLSVVKDFAEAKTQGSTMSFNLAGSSSAGANLTGTFSLAISAPTNTTTPIGMQTVNVLVQNVTLTDTGTGAFASGRATYYCYQTGYLYKIIYDDGTISTPTSQTLLPSSAKVGDFGDDMVVSNSDGSTDTSTWRIDPGANGDAKFVFIFTYRDNLNAVIETEEDSYTIKPDGSISAVSVKYYDSSSGVTVTMSGNKN